MRIMREGKVVFFIILILILFLMSGLFWFDSIEDGLTEDELVYNEKLSVELANMNEDIKYCKGTREIEMYRRGQARVKEDPEDSQWWLVTLVSYCEKENSSCTNVGRYVFKANEKVYNETKPVSILINNGNLKVKIKKDMVDRVSYENALGIYSKTLGLFIDKCREESKIKQSWK